MSRHEQEEDYYPPHVCCEGCRDWPPMYSDQTRIHEVAEWDDALISERLSTYDTFLNRDLLPNHREQAARLMTHLLFEQKYRAGLYEAIPDDLSEVVR